MYHAATFHSFILETKIRNGIGFPSQNMRASDDMSNVHIYKVFQKMKQLFKTPSWNTYHFSAPHLWTFLENSRAVSIKLLYFVYTNRFTLGNQLTSIHNFPVLFS